MSKLNRWRLLPLLWCLASFRARLSMVMVVRVRMERAQLRANQGIGDGGLREATELTFGRTDDFLDANVGGLDFDDFTDAGHDAGLSTASVVKGDGVTHLDVGKNPDIGVEGLASIEH